MMAIHLLTVFVTLGVTLSTTGDSNVLCFTSVLLPQLRQSLDKKLDENQESWIASILGLALIVGILIVPSVMSRFGRRTANGISNGLLAVSWLGLGFTSDYYTILFIRFLQGLSTGMTAILAPIIIGEYSSPKYRGMFLTSIAMSYSLGALILHVLALFFKWQQLSFIFAGSSLLDCVIIMLSPESPSFLATQGRYEECRKAFHWLRHPDEEFELDKLIKANMKKPMSLKHKSNLIKYFRNKFNNFFLLMKKPEFYKPIIVMLHLHIINEWSASNLIEAYASDIFTIIIGSDENMPLMMVSTDVCKLISNCLAMVIISKAKRRVMLLGTISLNILSFILTAGHVYAKTHGISTFDYPIIGIFLINFHVFTLSIGNLALPNVIAGEIFALRYRGISSMITLLFFCVNMIINMKVALFLFAQIGLHGAYLVYAGLVGYGLLISWMMLPETKDKTLQDIEEEFRREKKNNDLEAFIPKVNMEIQTELYK